MFASAEARRVAEVTPLVLATYTGPGDRAAVVAFIEAKVRPWYGSRVPAASRPPPLYLRVE